MVQFNRATKGLIKAFSALNVGVYRATGGRLGRSFGPAPILLLTTIGRKSGQPRTVPLLYLDDGERIVIVASLGGSDQHPVWYLNLSANPDVEVEIGKQRRRVRARTATADERAGYWPRLLRIYRAYAGYQERTAREIPVVVLEPRE